MKRLNAIAVWAAPVLWIALLVLLSRRVAATYRDEEALLNDTVSRNPGCYVAYCGLGVLLGRQDRLDESKAMFDEALRLKPDYGLAIDGLARTEARIGLRAMAQGRHQEAAEGLERSIKLLPDLPETHFNLANAYSKLNQTAKSAAEYRETVRLKPDHERAWANLAVDCAALGLSEEARLAARRARDLYKALGDDGRAAQIDQWLSHQ